MRHYLNTLPGRQASEAPGWVVGFCEDPARRPQAPFGGGESVLQHDYQCGCKNSQNPVSTFVPFSRGTPAFCSRGSRWLGGFRRGSHFLPIAPAYYLSDASNAVYNFRF